MYGKSNMETYITICKMGICCMAQETQTGLCINLERWDGEGDEREGIYVYLILGMIMLRFDRKQKNSVKQFCFN